MIRGPPERAFAHFVECLRYRDCIKCAKAHGKQEVKLFGICIYEDFYNYIYGKRIYIDKATIKDIGKSEWYDLLHEFVGALVIDRRNGIAVDTLYMELVELFPWIFSDDTVAAQDQLEKILNTYRQARRERRVEKGRNDKGG